MIVVTIIAVVHKIICYCNQKLFIKIINDFNAIFVICNFSLKLFHLELGEFKIMFIIRYYFIQ